jgi:hypothetical protein
LASSVKKGHLFIHRNLASDLETIVYGHRLQVAQFLLGSVEDQAGLVAAHNSVFLSDVFQMSGCAYSFLSRIRDHDQDIQGTDGPSIDLFYAGFTVNQGNIVAFGKGLKSFLEATFFSFLDLI